MLPTVTDANLVLGALAADNVLGGRMTLDKGAAEKAINTHVADPLGLSVVEAAAGDSGSVTLYLFFSNAENAWALSPTLPGGAQPPSEIILMASDTANTPDTVTESFVALTSSGEHFVAAPDVRITCLANFKTANPTPSPTREPTPVPSAAPTPAPTNLAIIPRCSAWRAEGAQPSCSCPLLRAWAWPLLSL